MKVSQLVLAACIVLSLAGCQDDDIGKIKTRNQNATATAAAREIELGDIAYAATKAAILATTPPQQATPQAPTLLQAPAVAVDPVATPTAPVVAMAPAATVQTLSVFVTAIEPEEIPCDC